MMNIQNFSTDEKSTFVTCQQINRQNLLDQLTIFKNKEDIKFWILEQEENQFKIIEGNKEETKSIYSVHNTNNENEISQHFKNLKSEDLAAKNIWIVNNENG